MKLYEIPEQYRAWERAIDEADGELTPELEAWLQDMASTLESKAEAVAALVREANAEAELYRHEAEHFTAKARVAKNRSDRLKKLLLDAMEGANQKQIVGHRFTVSIRQASQPSIRWEGEGEIPEPFARVTVEVDGTAAQRAFREGRLAEGFSVKFSSYLNIR